MAVEFRSSIGDIKHKITGSKLPFNGQVLAVLFYNIREVNLTVNESVNFAIRECIIFWEKARISTKSLKYFLRKLVNVYQVWKDLQNICKKITRRIQAASTRISPNRGHLGGVDKKLTDKEERARLRVVKEENRRIKYASASTSSASYEPLKEDSSSNSSENMDSEDFPILMEISEPGTCKSVMRKDFITQKLVAALDWYQLSMRDSAFILEATIDALGCNIDEFPVSESPIQRI
ncbi:hypothetical protein AVEN_83833-1 [Araneus ventricosus]|uniref:Uncharacterized protein n=1 Tax=Araneus ventricosus TaxID=182803 RepID=A0A4Y2KHA8_ARAVE|nr:hypothetical protein AVEN_83833-1 [Araneus ventricosus]